MLIVYILLLTLSMSVSGRGPAPIAADSSLCTTISAYLLIGLCLYCIYSVKCIVIGSVLEYNRIGKPVSINE
jgi:hypothetical protein